MATCERGFVTSHVSVSRSHSSRAARRELERNCSSLPLAATPGAGLEQDLPYVSSAGSWWETGKQHGRRMRVMRLWVVLHWFMPRFLHLSYRFPLESVSLWQEMWMVKRLVR